MRFPRSKRSRSLLLVGVWVNRNWILGNWIKEIALRSQDSAHVYWAFSVFAQKHFWEKFVKYPLPGSGAYFFSYPSMFESYLKSNPKRYLNRSIVNYTHNMDELGSLKHQARILNQAYSIHFNCSANAELLVNSGLNPKKVRLVFGAVDSDCSPQPGIKRENKTILLASRYSERKGLDILPQVVDRMPEWKFIILGRGWEGFLKKSKLDINPNVEYQIFTKDTRNDTGFARDIIVTGKNGVVIPNPPTVVQVHKAILTAADLTESPQESVAHLTWDRLANIVMSDANAIWNSGSSKVKNG